MPSVPPMAVTDAEAYWRTQRRRLLFVAATVIASLQSVFRAQAAEVERDGPWAFTERIDKSTHELEQLAVTPAAEDTDVWLLLACSQSRFTASLMHNAQFPFAVGQKSTLVLQTNHFPIVSVEAMSVQENQLTINAAISRHLAPLFFNADKIVIAISHAGPVTRDYTFSLQPNGASLARIVRDCRIDG